MHHKPVYVPGLRAPEARAERDHTGNATGVRAGRAGVLGAGSSAVLHPGSGPRGYGQRYVSSKPPVIVPAKKGTIIPGEFTPASYTPGFVIPGFHETTACAVPVCAPPCQRQCR